MASAEARGTEPRRRDPAHSCNWKNRPVLAAINLEISLGDADPWAASSRPALLAFVAFLGAFLFIRTSARLMRSPKVPWWPGSVTSGDLHIHTSGGASVQIGRTQR